MLHTPCIPFVPRCGLGGPSSEHMRPCNVPAICSIVLQSVYMKLLDAIQVHVYIRSYYCIRMCAHMHVRTYIIWMQYKCVSIKYGTDACIVCGRVIRAYCVLL